MLSAGGQSAAKAACVPNNAVRRRVFFMAITPCLARQFDVSSMVAHLPRRGKCACCRGDYPHFLWVTLCVFPSTWRFSGIFALCNLDAPLLHAPIPVSPNPDGSASLRSISFSCLSCSWIRSSIAIRSSALPHSGWASHSAFSCSSRRRSEATCC